MALGQKFRLSCYTFRLPPVMVTLTKRRVYKSLLWARPLATLRFSVGSTYFHQNPSESSVQRASEWEYRRKCLPYLWSLRLDFARTGERAVDFTHVDSTFWRRNGVLKGGPRCKFSIDGWIPRWRNANDGLTVTFVGWSESSEMDVVVNRRAKEFCGLMAGLSE